LASPSSKGVLLVHAAKTTVVCFYQNSTIFMLKWF
jgi:hypothetical protein